MSASASETGRLLAESASAFVARRRVAQAAEGAGEVWREIIELGWLGLLISEERGGSGLSGRDLVALGEALGPLLRPEPIISSIASATILAGIGTVEARSLLSDLLDGRAIVVPAVEGSGPTPSQRYRMHRSHAPVSPPQGAGAQAASPGPESRVITESASHFAHFAQSASCILAWDAPGERVVAVPASDSGLRQSPTIDGGLMVWIPPVSLRSCNAPVLGAGAEAWEAFQRGMDALALGTAALLVGLAQRALNLTLEHLRTREQFGVPIGSFQALQHRCASLHVAIASSRALLGEAGLAFDGTRRSAACAAVRARAAEIAKDVVEEAVQLHGAIGYTADHEVGRLLKRALALRSAWGSPAAWRRRFREASCRGADPGEPSAPR